MAEYVGSRVQFVADDEDIYTGLLKSVDQNSGRISINEVKCNDKPMGGTQFFFRQNIDKLKVIDVLPIKSSIVEDRYGGRVMNLTEHHEATHLKNLREVREEELILKRANETRDNSAKEDEIPLGTTTTFRSKRMNTVITVFSALDNSFNDAIELLSCEKVLGVALQGVEISRTGSLCLIQFALDSCILIFDIQILGLSAFEQGLGRILQDPHIIKIIHDCRHVSDLLFHKYSVKLVNVFDTQVADAVIFRHFDNRQRCPNFVNGLHHCILQYLADDTDDLYPNKVRQSCRKVDELVWKKRPLNKFIIESAARAVIRLPNLRLAMMEQLMSEVTMGTDLFLSSIRDQPDELCISRGELAARVARIQSHKLPPEFSDIPYRLRNEGFRRTFNCSTNDGMAENCSGLDSRSIVYSKSGAWFHAPDHFEKKDQNSKNSQNSVPESGAKEKAMDNGSSPSTGQNAQQQSDSRVKKSSQSPEANNPLLRTSLIVQRSRMSSNMDLSQGPVATSTSKSELSNIKPAGHQANKNGKRRNLVALDDFEAEFDDEDVTSVVDYGIIPSVPQTPVFMTSPALFMTSPARSMTSPHQVMTSEQKGGDSSHRSTTTSDEDFCEH